MQWTAPIKRTALFTTLLVSLGSTPVAAADDASVERGRALAEVNCASCHAIGLSTESKHEAAPPFRYLSERFDVETIDEALLAKVRPSHDDMPTFEISPRQASDLVAYIATLQPVAHGRRLVEANCGACHATGIDDDSAHAEAPPFRVLGQLYPVETLEEALAEGIMTGHADMPQFTAEPDQIADIIAFLQSIQTP